MEPFLIRDPRNHKFVSILSKRGKHVLKKYSYHYNQHLLSQRGGELSEQQKNQLTRIEKRQAKKKSNKEFQEAKKAARNQSPKGTGKGTGQGLQNLANMASTAAGASSAAVGALSSVIPKAAPASASPPPAPGAPPAGAPPLPTDNYKEDIKKMGFCSDGSAIIATAALKDAMKRISLMEQKVQGTCKEKLGNQAMKDMMVGKEYGMSSGNPGAIKQFQRDIDRRFRQLEQRMNTNAMNQNRNMGSKQPNQSAEISSLRNKLNSLVEEINQLKKQTASSSPQKSTTSTQPTARPVRDDGRINEQMRVIAIRGDKTGQFGQVGTKVGTEDDIGIIKWTVTFDDGETINYSSKDLESASSFTSITHPVIKELMNLPKKERLTKLKGLWSVLKNEHSKLQLNNPSGKQAKGEICLSNKQCKGLNGCYVEEHDRMIGDTIIPPFIGRCSGLPGKKNINRDEHYQAEGDWWKTKEKPSDDNTGADNTA